MEPLNNNILPLILISGFFGFLSACTTPNSSADEKAAETSHIEYSPEDNLVAVLVLEKTTFPRQLVSNGKLSALRKSDLQFSFSGQIKQLSVSNGNVVRKGEVIAVHDQSEYLHKRQQAQTSFKKAEMELQDVLIGQGYDLSDTSSIPKTVFEAAVTQVCSGSIFAGRQASCRKFDFGEARKCQNIG